MVNAIIVNKTLGLDNTGLFISLVFQIKSEGEKPYATIATIPISLVAPNETYTNSSAAQTLLYVLDTIGVGSWEDLIGKAVQIEYGENGISKIANVLDETKFFTLLASTAENINTDAEEIDSSTVEVVE